jgi:hypothetical protein
LTFAALDDDAAREFQDAVGLTGSIRGVNGIRDLLLRKSDFAQ